MNYGNAEEILKKTFNKENFNEVNFKEFLHHLFAKKINIIDSVQNVEPEYQSHIKSCKIIGEFVDINNQEIVLLIVKLAPQKELDRSRTLQRNFIAEILKNSFKSYALVAFVSSDEANWRFSLVKLEISFNENNLQEKLSSARRFSFLVGKNEGTHTVKSQFLKFFIDETQNIAPTIAQIEKLFDIEAVTDEFFQRYKELYHLFHESLDSFLEANEKEQKHFKEKEISTSDFAKKTLGQIVFLYFLQKKGWFGVKVGEPWGSGDKNFIANYFTRTKDHKNFFNECLEPLFYEALAVDRGLESIYSNINNLRFPFLNGGLFEPIRDYSWENTELNLPNELFSNSHPLPKIIKNSKEKNKFIEGEFGTGIFDIFDRYNFTVNENEPLENEVAIDPEMLGKVFENLLEIKDRKSKGAFYTPREIVHYMCQESLINYIHNHSDLPMEQLTNFIKNKSLENIENSALKIDSLLENVKICDPAVGSGAFMLGMLNEIVNARLQLNKILLKNRDEYALKFHAIANSIYGVDIDCGAVEIAKLRLWLALVVEEEKPSPLPNLDHKIMQGNSLIETIEGIKLFDDEVLNKNNKIENQESQIQKKLEIINKELILEAQNNKAKSQNPEYLAKLKEQSTLTKTLKNLKSYDQLDQIKEETKAPTLGFIDNENSAKNILLEKFYQLQKFIKNFFTENSRTQKLGLKKQIDELKWQFIEATLIAQKKQDKLVEIQNLRRKNIRPFFIWKLEFCDVFSGENPGFDIVIGNPPYIGEKGNKEIIRPIAQGNLKQYYQGKMDIFYFFFHLALIVGKTKSQIAFITSNYYITATGGKKLRHELKANSTILQLINFNELKIFESAKGQHNLITIFQKGLNQNIKTKTIQTKRKENATAKLLKNILEGKDLIDSSYQEISHDKLFDGEECYIRLGSEGNKIDQGIIERILGKVATFGTELGKITNVNQGLRTGCDKVTKKHIDLHKTEDLKKGDGIFILKNTEIPKLELFKNEENFLKPLYKNSDISRYYCKLKSEFKLIDIFYPNDKDIDFNQIVNIKRHLEKFKCILSDRKENANGIDKQIAKGNYFFASVRRKLNFESNKIVSPQRAKKNIFSFNDIPWYASADVYFITTKISNYIIELKYVLALLNSKLYYHWFYHRGKRKGEMLELYQKPLSEVPIKIISKTDQTPFIAIVDEILAITNKLDYNPDFPPLRQKELEAKIDEMVCDLYQLDDEEKKLILGEKNVF